MNDTIYGLREEEWPFEYLISALQILSLYPNELDVYIPKSVEKLTYDSGSGFVESDSPIVLTLVILLDCISPGRTWNEWINDSGLESEEIELGFQKLFSMLTKLAGEFDVDSEKWIRENLTNVVVRDEGWIAKLNYCRELAITILKKISLYQENTMPFKSWREMYEDLR